MKLNKKGFMLAEVVIVAGVIAGILITLYISLSQIAAAYEKRNKYYDIDAMYAAMEINDALVADNDGNVLTGITDVVKDYVTDRSSGTRIDAFLNFYPKTIKAAYFVYDDINNLEYGGDDKHFREYVTYLKSNLRNASYAYLIIVEIQKDSSKPDDVYFYGNNYKIS